jgi:hypothetical protein
LAFVAKSSETAETLQADVPTAAVIWKSLRPWWIPSRSRVISSLQSCLLLRLLGLGSKCGSCVMIGAEGFGTFETELRLVEAA